MQEVSEDRTKNVLVCFLQADTKSEVAEREREKKRKISRAASFCCHADSNMRGHMLVTCDLTDLFPRLTQSVVPHVNKFTQRFKRYLFSKWSVGKAARNDVGRESFFFITSLCFQAVSLSSRTLLRCWHCNC